MAAAIPTAPPRVEGPGAHHRLGGLLAVALAAGLVAGVVGNATADSTIRRVQAEPRAASARPAVACPLPAKFRSAFENASRDTGLPLSMLVAVGKIESNLHANATSAAGARGLLQLMPSTAAALQLNVDEPDANVLAGARYLRQMLDRFNSTDLALAAYNAGPTAVQEAGGAPSPEVQTYVSNVTGLWRTLAGCT